jgi:hypothetical protein
MKLYKIISTLVFCTIVLISCMNKPHSVEHLGKDDAFKVEYLFEKDGIKMYRFFDGGRFHYFTSLNQTITTHKHDDEIINTIQKEN